jgi:hypothetical protein
MLARLAGNRGLGTRGSRHPNTRRRSARGCRGSQHQLGRDAQDRKPQEGLQQRCRLLVGERVAG